MEASREQVTTLTNKVDSLYKIVEELNEKLTECISENKPTEPQRKYSHIGLGNIDKVSSYHNYTSIDSMMDHKDVLSDDNFSDTNVHGLDKELTADIQIQRLTAQLTAAYSRIAALEEQLLSQRVHF
jgi:regulator of replication initiation timing